MNNILVRVIAYICLGLGGFILLSVVLTNLQSTMVGGLIFAAGYFLAKQAGK